MISLGIGEVELHGILSAYVAVDPEIRGGRSVRFVPRLGQHEQRRLSQVSGCVRAEDAAVYVLNVSLSYQIAHAAR